jgi:hypothetical protein
MPGDAAESPATASLVVLLGEGVDWGFAVENVQEIVREAEWPGAAPFDVNAWWGGSRRETDAPSRVLVLQTRDGVCAVRAAGMSQRTVVRTDIRTLPPLAALGRAGRVIAGIVFSGSPRPLVVMNADAIAQIAAADPKDTPHA